jgi:HEAT repeat protein
MPVRAGVARVCGDLAVERVGAILLAALDDREWPVRAALCEAVGKLRPNGGAQAMAELLSDPEESVSEAAAEALAAFAAAEIEPHGARIIAAYQGGTIPVRKAVVSIAARIDNFDMTRILVQGVSDPSEAVRLRAVRSFSLRPSTVSVPPLIASLMDSSLEVRMAAASPLGATNDPQALEALLLALPGAPTEMRERIAHALAKVSSAQLLGRAHELAKSGDLNVRLGIAWTLGKRGDEAGLPMLAAFMRDPEPQLRASVAGALGKIPGSETVKVLLSAVADRDPKTRAAIVNALGKTAAGVDAARVALEQRLRDPDPFVRNRALIALARVDGAAATKVVALPEWRELIDDAPLILARGLIGSDEAIAEALAALMDPARLARLQEFIAREDPAIRSAFFTRLKLEDPGGADVEDVLNPAALVVRYEQLLRGSQDINDRVTAIEALARIRTDRSTAILAEALTADPAEHIRLRSAQALSTVLEDDVARAALIRAIADPSGDVATAAIRALSGIKDGRISAALFRRLGAGPSAMANVAEEALADLHKDDLVPLLDRIMGVDRTHALISALRVLGRIASVESLPLLRELLKSPDPSLRAGAVQAIAPIPTREAGIIVGKMLEDPHETVRMAALEALAMEGAEAALVRIAPARTDPSPRVRARLAELLTRFRGAGLRVLDSLVEDTSPIVRAEALGTLLAIADGDSLRRFVAAWSKARVEVRDELHSIARADAITRTLADTLATNADAFVREAAITGMRSLCVFEYEKHVERGLYDPKASVRLAAVLALSTSGGADVAKQLGPLLQDPDVAVRDAARQVINRTG